VIAPRALRVLADAPCRAACPVGTDAAGYVAAIADADVARAYAIARAHNPFPSICGRVCAAPCESACRRHVLDLPVAIRALKRSACEAFGVERDAVAWHAGHPAPPPALRESIGIVGAGPAGLAAAHDLRLLGHAVTLYEASDRAGGMMTLGIPEFRLPRAVLEGEVAAILSLGITLELRRPIGADLTIEMLLERHAALFVATGCGAGRVLDIPGRTLDGVSTAIGYLLDANRGATPPVKGRVVVVGGGAVAFDAARAAAREATSSAPGDMSATLDAARAAQRGGATVTVVAVESRAQLLVTSEEIEAAEAEGIALVCGYSTRAIVGEGQVRGVELVPVQATRTNGGLTITPTGGAARTLDADAVIFAVGQEADARFMPDALGIARTPWGGLVVDGDLRTAHPRIWSGGDLAHGPRNLVDAIADGQRAARGIATALGHPVPEATATPAPRVRRAPARRFWSGYDRIPRALMPVLPPDARTGGHEVERGFAPATAREEASRCLRCDDEVELDSGRCILCGLCVDACPMGCIAITAATTPQFAQMTLDDDRCIRCGLCVARCPADALALTGPGGEP
jgi:NADPH-dependent glutamate synthase beta subunit-like oxidoreductase/ferredoxin